MALALTLGLVFTWEESGAKPSKQEVSLSRIPRVKFKDWRLRRIHRTLGKQYLMMYRHAADDGYIWPNELNDLKAHRLIMHRMVIIDRQYKKIRGDYRTLRRLKRRRRLDAEGKKRLAKVKTRREYFERMVRRFACRYLKRYKRRHRAKCRFKPVKFDPEEV